MKKMIVMCLAGVVSAVALADSISITNFGFEDPAANKVVGWNGESGTEIPGWASDTAASDSGVASEWTGWTEGSYSAFVMAADSSIYNLTDYVIQAGDVFTLQVDSRNNWSESGTAVLLMSLYYEDAGSRITLASVTIDPMTDDWTTYSLVFAADDVVASIGNKIGIELDNGAAVGRSWLGLDNVRLDVVPEPATLSLLTVGVLAVIRRRKSA